MQSNQPIASFREEYRFLSNFYPCKVDLDGLTFPTVEHAYQAAKTRDIHLRLCIRMCATPGRAKAAGRAVDLRPDWEEVKENIMSGLLQKKFELDPLRSRLLATGDRPLIEGNNWGDRYWGVSGGSGLNRLGVLLMRVRALLREADAE